MYTQHGGSGLGFSKSEAEDLLWDEAEWYLETLEKTRQAEADAMRAAHRSKR
jgi:hypothetical protein